LETRSASPRPATLPDLLTFRLETKSAVSKRVNWLIWSTIPAILGLAASVELFRRAILCWRTVAEAFMAPEDRSWRAQHWAAYRQDSDISLVRVHARRCSSRERLREAVALSLSTGGFCSRFLSGSSTSCTKLLIGRTIPLRPPWCVLSISKKFLAPQETFNST